MVKVTHAEILSILENAEIAADVTKIQRETSLREAGVDSLDMANALLLIEEKFKVKIPDEDINALDSIDSIVSYLQRL